MATDVYLSATASDIDPTADTDLMATLSQHADEAASTTNTVTGPTSGVQATDTAGGNKLAWFTKPLAGVTISGTISFTLPAGVESSMNANAGLQVKVERCDNAGAVISTVVNSEKGTELPTSAASQSWTASPTSTTLNTGDRLKITVFGNDVGTMGSGFTFGFNYGDDSSTATFRAIVNFTETLTEDSGTSEQKFWPRVMGVVGMRYPVRAPHIGRGWFKHLAPRPLLARAA